MPVERRGQAIAFEIGSTGNGRNPIFNGRRQPSSGGTSRMTRECQVRICERLGVKFPGPTRPTRTSRVRLASAVRGNPGPYMADCEHFRTRPKRVEGKRIQACIINVLIYPTSGFLGCYLPWVYELCLHPIETR